MHNTTEIVTLISKNASLNTRVHTFGVGNGADEHLITRSAFAGFGHHYFIYNEEEIEEKVILALTKTALDYKVITDFAIFDAAKTRIPVPFEQSLQLRNASKCEWTALLPIGVPATYFEAKIVDPNTLETTTFAGKFLQCGNMAVHSHAV